jgi:hypothetical protein
MCRSDALRTSAPPGTLALFAGPAAIDKVDFWKFALKVDILPLARKDMVAALLLWKAS